MRPVDATAETVPEAAPGVLALFRICVDPDAPARLAADADRYLADLGLGPSDRAALLATGPRRLVTYRRLVHNRLRNATRGLMPRTVARRGDAAFGADFDGFMAERGPKSPYLRDVPGEFLAWVAPRWADAPDVPPYLAQLGRYELLDYEVANEPSGGEPHTGRPLALDRPLRVDGSVRLARFDYGFHRLPRNPKDRTVPEQADTPLLVYRDRTAYKARYLLLSSFGWELMRRIVEDGSAVEPALREACAALGRPLDDHHLAVAAELFADLEGRGVLLGAR
ncbi:MAG: hypothetical protein D6705_02755 [Deltaproteobacteria bacterium]|nr:MAG: hypothetical protein D6705_02755 [Deltaproteobacteria bacterium]